MKTVSDGRMPIPHMIRACALAIARQSSRPMPNAVGRPVVPLVPCTRTTSVGLDAGVGAERRVLGLVGAQLVLA